MWKSVKPRLGIKTKIKLKEGKLSVDTSMAKNSNYESKYRQVVDLLTLIYKYTVTESLKES